MEAKCTRTRDRRKGASMLEFTLVAIPIVFGLISIFEIARGMWIYGTVSNAVREGTRFTIVRGSNCATSPNACSARIANIASRIQNMGPGLLGPDFALSFTSDSGTITCQLDQCLSDNRVWPPTGDNARGQAIRIDGAYPFRSAIVMFWPGAGGPVRFTAMKLNASSQETIQF